MNTAVVYCCPVVQRRTYALLAQQFARTWRQCPPGNSPHELWVVYNGEPMLEVDRAWFAGLPHRELHHNNAGWDIGAFLLAAARVPADLMIFLGSHIRFHHPGWLDRMVGSYLQDGPGLFGPWGADYPNPHIRTTAFWCAPQLLLSYPYLVTSERPSRYAFEHGGRSFTRHCLDCGLPAVMVTMAGSFPWPAWKGHEPDAANSIVLDKQHA